jgi:DNA repair protein RecO (recombination protein O)
MRRDPERGLWPAVTYFSLWAVRLSGFLPDLPVSTESRRIAEEMMQKPIAQLTDIDWTRRTASDLRRFLVRQIQDHIEHKLLSAPMLEAL